MFTLRGDPGSPKNMNRSGHVISNFLAPFLVENVTNTKRKSYGRRRQKKGRIDHPFQNEKTRIDLDIYMAGIVATW
jgi:hypothetical protein